MIWRRFQLVVTAAIGFVAFFNAFTTLRDQRFAGWMTSLLLCVIAGAAWMLTISTLRSARPAVTTDTVEAAPQSEPEVAQEESLESRG